MADQSKSQSKPTTKPTPRRRRKWPVILACLVLALLALVALAPTLISWGLGKGMIARTINKSVNGTVTINDLHLSWFGGQSVRGFTLTDPSGKQAANLDVQVQSSLWQIVTQRPGPLAVTLSGTLDGELREDGSISFEDLLIPPAKKPPGSPPPPTAPQPRKPGAPIVLPQLPPLDVHINALTLNLSNRKTGQALALQDLTGRVQYDPHAAPPQGPSVELHGKTLADGTAGTVDLTAQAGHVADAAGALTLAGTTARVDLKAKSIPLPLRLPGEDQPTQLEQLTLSLISDDLTGKIVVAVNADAQTKDRPPSHVQAEIALNKVLDSQGGLALAGGSASINVQGENVPFVAGDMKGIIETLRGTVISDDLTKITTLAADSNTHLEGQDSSVLAASLNIDGLFTPQGKLQLAADKVTGTIQGNSLPTALLQPFLSSTPILVSRDLGPVMAVEATFSAGTRRTVSINAASPWAKLEVKGELDAASGAFQGSHLLLSARDAQPELIRGFTSDAVIVDRPVAVAIRLDSFTVPPKDSQTHQYALSRFAAAGTIKLAGPTSIALAAAPKADQNAPPSGGGQAASQPQARSLAFQDMELRIESPGLGDHLKVEGSANIEGAAITLNETITNLFDAQGKLAPINAIPAGTLSVNNLPASSIVGFAPDQAALINEVVGASLSATVTTTLQESNLAATVQVKTAGGGVESTINVVRRPDALGILSGHIALNVTPKLAALLQKTSANPVVLQAPAAVAIDVQAFDLPATGPLQYAMSSQPIHATVEVPQVIVDKVPALVEPLGLAGVVADISIARENQRMVMTANGDATLRRTSADQVLAVSRFKANFVMQNGQAGPITLDIGLNELSVRRLERMLGQPVGTYAQWTGDQGGLVFVLEGSGGNYQAKIHSALPNLTGDFTAAIDSQAVDLTAKTSTLTLNHRAIEKRLNMPPAKSAAAAGEAGSAAAAAPPPPSPSQEPSAAPAGRIRVEEDVPLQLTINKLRLPLALLKHQAFDPKAVAIDVGLAGGPLKVITPDQARTVLSNLKIALTSTDLSDGLGFTIRGKADATLPESETAEPESSGTAAPAPRKAVDLKPGVVDVKGKLVDLVSQDSMLHPESAKLQMVAKLSEVPTAVADAFANMQGLLVAAVGPVMSATFDADDFSADSGRMEMHIQTSNGSLETVVRGKDDVLHVNKARPVKAELAITPPLRQRLLYEINPILSDIRSTEHPLRVNIPSAAVPLDGDVRKLRADIEITIGKVALDSGSTTLSVLRFFKQDKKRKTIPAEIEPIDVKIRNGVVKYDKFAIHVDKYTLNYFGEINLVKRTVDLHTEVPLKALGLALPELEEYAEAIIVPLVTRGDFGAVKTQIDPDFDLGKAALKAGFSGGVENLLKGKAGGINDLLKDLIKPK